MSLQLGMCCANCGCDEPDSHERDELQLAWANRAKETHCHAKKEEEEEDEAAKDQAQGVRAWIGYVVAVLDDLMIPKR